MDFSKKLQELRKQKGLTQEEVAEALFVSRSAVSKWESGRGYPGIDSLKEIAGLFSVTVDELLSGEEILSLAEKDSREKKESLRNLIFSLLDLAALMLLFLPLFAQRENGVISEVSLLSLESLSPLSKGMYFGFVFLSALFGASTLILQGKTNPFWKKIKLPCSFVLSGAGTLIFILGLHPYGASFLLLFFFFKVLILIKTK